MTTSDWYHMPPEQRLKRTIDGFKSEQALWILTDNDGAVMLTTDEGDGIPVWPTQALAKDWANNEWSSCTPKGIPLTDWLDRWTDGLAEDEVDVVICPVPGEDGLIISSDELAHYLTEM
ncbi:DUF2750 domain-containing protein [Aestuariibacter halophilus]|uniref:DUF2750 domain-containing protein n=1 Tax=Fluctibacter halophilus TaxID=226011 RepID=A0ABS8GBL5_9ALTE|nr:DUF2750 domain-containing protein [Aestuariibacter halophilus]MCC2617451.1 DUF2750 domain-containing protein [Aestuariibacter halophilus]